MFLFFHMEWQMMAGVFHLLQYSSISPRLVKDLQDSSNTPPGLLVEQVQVYSIHSLDGVYRLCRTPAIASRCRYPCCVFYCHKSSPPLMQINPPPVQPTPNLSSLANLTVQLPVGGSSQVEDMDFSQLGRFFHITQITEVDPGDKVMASTPFATTTSHGKFVASVFGFGFAK